jgi:hypothetical protein
MTGEGEEHVVKGRLADFDVIDGDAGVVEGTDDGSSQARAAAHRGTKPAAVMADVHGSGDQRCERRDRRSVPAPVSVTSRRAPPVWALSSADVPPAMARP